MSSSSSSSSSRSFSSFGSSAAKKTTTTRMCGRERRRTEKERTRRGHSLWPSYPPGTRVLVERGPDADLVDRLVVYLSSLFFVGSVAWVPWLLYRALRAIEPPRRRLACAAAVLALAVVGPHRSPSVGERVGARRWRLWDAWLRYLGVEVVTDAASRMVGREAPALIGVSPHGVFPFSVAFAALPDAVTRGALGRFRPVVATATNLFPFVNTFLKWLGAVDASRAEVRRALSATSPPPRLGLSPGGIAEMFEDYPKRGVSPDRERSLLSRRKGFVRMALRHGVPLVPVYCFGNSRTMRRLNAPWLDRLSNALRISLCLAYGRWGLPIPFRQRLLYVVGEPVVPPPYDRSTTTAAEESRMVDETHRRFVEEIVRIFEKYKESYGWGHRTLDFA